MWAGTINLQAGGHLVAVAYDTPDTAAAISASCEPWLSDDEREVPAAFGLRVTRVGFRRRTAVVLHHGAPARARFAGLDDAAATLARFMQEAERFDTIRRERPGVVTVEGRVFVRAGRAVLLLSTNSCDIDERRLARRGIDEAVSWRPMIDPATGTVTVGDESWPVSGIVLDGHGPQAHDDLRRIAWSCAEPSEFSWAHFIDSLGDNVRPAADDVEQALIEAYSRAAP